MRIFVLLAALFALSSCGVIQEWMQGAAEKAVVSYVEKNAPAEIVAQVDTDQSGDTTWDEWKTFLGSGGIITILTWWINNRMKKKVGNLYAESAMTNGQLAKMRELMVKDGKLQPGELT